MNLESSEDRVEDVATKVTKAAITKILPVSPSPRVIDSASYKGAYWRNANPLVPVESLWYGCGLRAAYMAGLSMSSSVAP